MVKIIPPKSWRPRSTPYEQSLENLMVKHPIEQNPQGKSGIYEFKHMSIDTVSYPEFMKQHQHKQYFLEEKSSEQIESMFWKTLPYSPPVYGADLVGSLMDESAQDWNLNSLKTILQLGLPQNLRGVNTSYCYIGSWKALFCWHKQDLDLEAINFLHFGKPKFWYCIQPQDSAILEAQAKKHFYKGFQLCPEYLRHKTCLINPYLLKKQYPQLRISKIQQNPGQFIIAFAGAYHCGFNFGVNVAEAVNFASMDWLYRLKNAKYCRCKSSSVRVSYQYLVQKLAAMPQYAQHPVVKQLRQQMPDRIVQDSVEEQSGRKDVTHNPKKTKPIQKEKEKTKQQKNPKAAQKNSNKDEFHIQCDRCDSWHKLSSEWRQLAKLHKFYCDNLGKACQFQKPTNDVEQAQSGNHIDIQFSMDESPVWLPM